MTKRVTYGCDVCGHPIKGDHQELFMATIRIDYKTHVDDGSAAGTEARQDIFHVHADLSNHCLRKVWGAIPKGKDEDKSSKQT